MSKSFESASCPLCGTQARTKGTDYDNYDVFLCSNSVCGDSEISLEAQNRIRKSAERGKQLQAEARTCKSLNKVLQIKVDSDNQLKWECIEER